MAEYELSIPGEPAPWMVYTRRGQPSAGFLRMQTWQEKVRAAIISKYGRPMRKEALMLEVVFHRSMPKPWPKADGAWSRKRAAWDIKRPDLTNLLKALEDALVGILIRDDAQVIRTTVSKMIIGPGEEPGAHLVVTVVE